MKPRLTRLILFFICGLLGAPGSPLANLVGIDTDTKLKAVYLIEDPDNEIIQVNLVVLAGEVDFEGPEGLAHYLEHLMFWHADKVNNKRLHGRVGNAWINGIITNYHNSGNKAELDDLFKFAERLTGKPELSKRFMLEERDVVAREYDLRVSENPDRKAYDVIAKALFKDNPVGRSTIGTLQSINSLTIDQAVDFHSKFYVPENMALIVSGNISKEEVRQKTEAAFGGKTGGMANPRTWYQTPVEDTEKLQFTAQDKNAVFDSHKFGALANWEGTGDAVLDWYIIEFVEELLRSALPGGLAKPLRTDAFIVREFSVYLREMIDGQVMFGFEANPDEGVTFEEVDSSIRRAMNAISQSGVSDKTIERLKKRWLRVADRRADDTDFIRQRILNMLTAGLSPTSSTEHRKRIENIDKFHVDGLIRALAKPHRQIEYHLTKKEP